MTSVAQATQTVTTEYNGWTNRETWLVNLWLSESMDSYYFLRRICKKNCEVWEKAEELEAHFQDQLEDKVNKNDLPQRLALLKLTQMAAKLYQTRTIGQKRFILTKLFTSFMYRDGAVSVTYSKFASVIANKTLKTKEILGR